MNKTVFPVFSFNLMRFLDNRGFKFFDAKPNTQVDGKVVFYYDNTPELSSVVEEYVELIK